MPRPTRLVPGTLLALAVWLAPPSGAGAAPAARHVTRTVLPALPGSDPEANTEAGDIDNHGRIVGSSDDKPVMWHDGEVVELTGFPDDAVVPAASQINDQGEVLLPGYTAAGAYPVYYLWQDGRAVEVELAPGVRPEQVSELNERGQAFAEGYAADGRFVGGIWEDGAFTEIAEWDTGYGTTPADPSQWRYFGVAQLAEGGGYLSARQLRGVCSFAPGSCETRPVLWHAGETTVLPGGAGDTVGVNSRGDVIGESEQYGGTLWRDGQPVSLGMSPHDINDEGQIVGHWQLWWTIPRGVIWEDGQAVDLGTLGGWTTRPIAINESGQVVGYSQTASGEEHLFLWDDGEMVDLTPDANEPLPDPWLIGMNDHGQVIGYSETRQPNNAELWEVSDG